MYALPSSADFLELQFGEKTYQIELAMTKAQRRQGLMHRESLAPERGMLLVYSDQGDHRIWMKNVLIPLRVYWINAEFKVISLQRLPPCRSPSCPVYAAPSRSQFVLELGDYDHELKLGDRIDELANLRRP